MHEYSQGADRCYTSYSALAGQEHFDLIQVLSYFLK